VADWIHISIPSFYGHGFESLGAYLHCSDGTQHRLQSVARGSHEHRVPQLYVQLELRASKSGKKQSLPAVAASVLALALLGAVSNTMTDNAAVVALDLGFLNLDTVLLASAGTMTQFYISVRLRL
jgi:hypothetical protein